MTDATHSPTPRLSWRFRWALVASIALNVFFLGLSVGALVNRPPPGPPRSLAERMDGRLSPDGATRIAQRLRSFDSGVSSGFDAFDAARPELRRLADTDPFDGEALAAELDRLSTARSTQEHQFTRLIVDMLRDLDRADRSAFIETLLPPRRPSPGTRLEPPPR